MSALWHQMGKKSSQNARWIDTLKAMLVDPLLLNSIGALVCIYHILVMV